MQVLLHKDEPQKLPKSITKTTAHSSNGYSRGHANVVTLEFLLFTIAIITYNAFYLHLRSEKMAVSTHKLASGDHLEFDKSGIPLYAGQLELLEEYAQRAWDLFHGRTGNNSLQAATPIHLRSGCRGVVYEAVKELSHSDLLTTSVEMSTDDPPVATVVVKPDGMALFLSLIHI